MFAEKFKAAAEAWLRTQDISIESCDINIEHYKKQISVLQKLIYAEQEERKAKIEMKVAVLENLKKVTAKKELTMEEKKTHNS